MTITDVLPAMRSFSPSAFAARFSARRSESAPAPTAAPAAVRPESEPRKAEPRAPRKVEPLRPRIEIPVRDPSPAHKIAEGYRDRGRFLARQEEWETLGREICAADRDRLLTKGLRSVAALLAEGARSDAVEAGRAAVQKGEANAARAILTALELNMEEIPDCPATAYVVAMAHIDLARAWAGASRAADLSPPRFMSFKEHMGLAAELADRFDPFETQSPLWAEVRCRVLDIDPRPSQRVCDDYEDLIDLEPGNPDHLRALGRDLLPRRFGNRETLEREARRAAMRTEDVWGVGGYSWVYMGAIEKDPDALRGLDADLFAEGLHDILSRHPGQDMANRLAAFTGMTASSVSAPGTIQARISDCFNWIAQDHLHELHPAVWALAPAPSREERVEIETCDLVKRGRTRAISALAEHFAPLLDGGRRLVFTPQGLQMPRLD
ncbi:hypothetical protein [Tropicibacter oceani]|uniref:Uncharacterized protein n=1 Tax=Tropicibacter oceani TaxID=3058420 RepID=A0ABY8QFG6_9RHOB|nr:hypothetical protein [Tropicibacter oceani]WGW03280.1 hypothetical protein QF118_15305 [Tropicibacter oceani]